jgi:hypothetical protein
MFSRLFTPVALLAAMVVAPAMAADSDSALAKDRGQFRPLIVIARSASDPSLEALKKDLADPATNKAFQDRKMVLYTVVGTIGQRDGKNLDPQATMAMIRELNLGVSDATRVVLVGLDGGKKIDDKGNVDLKKIFSTIDAMPMAEKEAAAPPPAKAAPAGKPAKGAKPGKAAPAEDAPPAAGLDD